MPLQVDAEVRPFEVDVFNSIECHGQKFEIEDLVFEGLFEHLCSTKERFGGWRSHLSLFAFYYDNMVHSQNDGLTVPLFDLSKQVSLNNYRI